MKNTYDFWVYLLSLKIGKECQKLTKNQKGLKLRETLKYPRGL